MLRSAYNFVHGRRNCGGGGKGMDRGLQQSATAGPLLEVWVNRRSPKKLEIFALVANIKFNKF